MWSWRFFTPEKCPNIEIQSYLAWKHNQILCFEDSHSPMMIIPGQADFIQCIYNAIHRDAELQSPGYHPIHFPKPDNDRENLYGDCNAFDPRYKKYVFLQQPVPRLLVEHNHMIGHLPSATSKPPFRNTVLPGTTKRNIHQLRFLEGHFFSSFYQCHSFSSKSFWIISGISISGRLYLLISF